MRKIIAFCGFIGSGKDTAANTLLEKLGNDAVKLSFAGILKDIVSCVFCWNRQMLEGDTQESRIWREQIDEWWSKRLVMPHLTPRWVLQNWGTNILRNQFHDEIWIAALEKKLYSCEQNTILITDCRFTNEMEFLRKLHRIGAFDVKFVWVRRYPIPLWVEDYLATGNIPSNVHCSEFQWLNIKFDKIIDNDVNIDAFKEKVLQELS